jgi:hypothetical protein
LDAFPAKSSGHPDEGVQHPEGERGGLVDGKIREEQELLKCGSATKKSFHRKKRKLEKMEISASQSI